MLSMSPFSFSETLILFFSKSKELLFCVDEQIIEFLNEINGY